jgi:hypothetical protein
VKWRCAICGRVTLQPAVMLGAEPIGPKCARRAGLLKLAKRPGSRLSAGKRHAPHRDAKTRDLFEGLAA